VDFDYLFGDFLQLGLSLKRIGEPKPACWSRAGEAVWLASRWKEMRQILETEDYVVGQADDLLEILSTG